MLDNPENWAILLWILGGISGTFGLWVVIDFAKDVWFDEKKHNPTAGIKDTRLHSDTSSETMQKMILEAKKRNNYHV